MRSAMMQSVWISRIAVAAAFPVVVMLLVPSTETKASWSTIHHDVTPYMPASTTAESAPEIVYPATYIPDTRTARMYDDGPTAEELAVADRDRAYGDGYAWAADRGVQSARECHRLDEGRAAGCRDFIASLPDENAEEASASF